MEQIQQKKLIAFSMGYSTNLMYVLLVFIIGMFVDVGEKNPYMGLLIIGVPALFTMFFTTLYLRSVTIKDIEPSPLIIQLALRHVISIFGLIGSILYLFV